MSPAYAQRCTCVCNCTCSDTRISRLACLCNCWSFAFFLSLIFSFYFSPLLSPRPCRCSHVCLPAGARSPLESSVPCLATRSPRHDVPVPRSPSLGWISKCGRGRGGGSPEEHRGDPHRPQSVSLTLPHERGKRASVFLVEWLLLWLSVLPHCLHPVLFFTLFCFFSFFLLTSAPSDNSL